MRAALLWPLFTGCAYVAVDGSNPGDDDDDNVVVGDDDDDGPPPAGVECDPAYETPVPGAVGEGDCVTDVITCGDTLYGTTAGGSTTFSNEYEQAFEWCSTHGEGEQLSGPERVYRMEVPSGVEVVTATLASCADSQLLWYQTTQVCPVERLLCQTTTTPGSKMQGEDILLSGSNIIWFVVESYEGATGNFALTVACPE